jgi:DivIVA domain-containing protein
MADRRANPLALPPAVAAEEVTRRTFSTSFRGYDQGEVRDFLAQIADGLRDIDRRQDEMAARLKEAQQKAAHPAFDDDVLTTALGEEAARVLHSARAAAADIRHKGEQNAAEAIEEARQDAAQIVAASASVLDERTREAELAAQVIAATAQADADALRGHALEEASRVLDEARARSEEMLGDAEDLRSRVLSELMRKRRVVHAQVEQLGAGRDSLMGALDGVRDMLDGIGESLLRAEAEAKRAADHALRNAMASPEPTADELREQVGEPVVELIAGPAPAALPRQPASAGPPSKAAPAADSVYDAEGSVAKVVETVVEAVAEQTAPESPRGRGAKARGAGSKPSGSKPSGSKARIVVPPEALAGQVGELQADEGVRIIGLVSEASAPAERPEPPASAEQPEGSVSPVSSGSTDSLESLELTAIDEASMPGSPGDALSSSSVDDLFARIRAERAAATADAERVLSESAPPQDTSAPAGSAAEAQTEDPGAADPEVVPGAQPVLGADVESADVEGPEVEGAAEPERGADHDGGKTQAVGGDAQPVPNGGGAADLAEAGDKDLAVRNRLLGPVHDKLVRKLKRALQDDQNDILDRIRAAKGSALPDLDEHRRRYAEVSRPFLLEALGAGRAYALEVFGVASSSAAPAGRGSTAAAIADRLAESVMTPLRDRVASATSSAGVDDGTRAVDVVGAAFRSWKGERIDGLAMDHAVEAFGRGLAGCLPSGTVVRWLVDDDVPCPDCDDNELAGSTAVGESFPTGQSQPPAHPGCRCLLVPPRA